MRDAGIHMKTTLFCLVIVALGSLSACTTVVKEPPTTTETSTTETTTLHHPAATETQTVRSY
jgi:hypothetical protein